MAGQPQQKKSGIIQKVFGWILGGTQNEQFITRLPDFQSLEEVAGFIDTKFQEENAQLKAENLRQKRQLEEKKVGKKQAKEEDQLLDYALKQKQQFSREKSFRTLKLKLDLKESQLPIMFLRNNKGVGKFQGFILQETPEGTILYYPWLKVKTPEGKMANVKFERHAFHMEDFFKDELGVVSQMRAGKIDTNFDIGENNEPIIRAPPHKLVVEKTGKDAVTVDELKKLYEQQRLGETERREYEQKISSTKDQLNQAYSMLQDLQKREVEYHKKIADLEVDTAIATETAELYGATVAAEAKNKPSVIKVVTDSLMSIQDTKASQILTERMNNTINDANAKLRKKYGESLYKDEREVEESRQKDMIRSVATEVTRQQKPSPTRPTPTPAET